MTAPDKQGFAHFMLKEISIKVLGGGKALDVDRPRNLVKMRE